MSINSQSAILHMSNLPFDTTEEDLRDFFRSYQVSFLSLISKAAKKYARIEFATPGIAEKVLNELNGVNFLPKSTKTGLMKVISLSKFEEKDQFSFKNDVSKNVLVKNVPLNFTGREFFLMMKNSDDRSSRLMTVPIRGVKMGPSFSYVLSITPSSVDGDFMIETL